MAMEDSGNIFPRSAFALPTTQIMFAQADDGILLTQPFYLSLVLGSLAWSGKPTEMEKAACQKAMVQAAFTIAHQNRLYDIRADTHTPETRAFALRHGFTIGNHAALKMSVR